MERFGSVVPPNLKVSVAKKIIKLQGSLALDFYVPGVERQGKSGHLEYMDNLITMQEAMKCPQIKGGKSRDFCTFSTHAGTWEDASTPAASTQVRVKEWNRKLNWKCNQPGDV